MLSYHIVFVFLASTSGIFSQNNGFDQIVKLVNSGNPLRNSFFQTPFPSFLPRQILELETVQTPNGLVIGRRMESGGKRDYFYAFRGIRYAEPPLGILRFKPPVPYTRPNILIDAREDGNICMQTSGNDTLIIGSEDCLFINVYVPEIRPENKLPVMVFIYGGGFINGGSSYSIYGPDFILDNNVVYVSFNYRLGPFGFLSTEDMVLPGNNGLKDQLLALKWVKSNIQFFGGNPDEVTIMGQSAGAASVSYLVQSNLAKGLFKRAIMLSGNTLCPWSLARHPRQTAFKIGSQLGIQTNSSQDLITALTLLPPQVVVLSAMVVALSTDDPLNLVIAPVKEPEHLDGIFSDRSYRILTEDQLNANDIMIGFTSAEGIAFLYTNDSQNYIKESFLVPEDMHIEDQAVRDIVRQEVFNYYYPNSDVTLQNAATQISDNYFVRGTIKYIKLASARQTVYAYEFSYMGELGKPGPRLFDGVGHAEDIQYIFRNPNQPSPISASDNTTRCRWVKFITNFASTGSPTPTEEILFENIIWNPVSTPGDLSYLDFDNNLTMKVNPRAESMLFWDNLYETYAVQPYDTY